MIKKIPISAAELPWATITAALPRVFAGLGGEEKLAGAFLPLINKKHALFFNSGLAAFYMILETLKPGSPKREVVLPAYTAGSLVVAIKKAGLKPVLCDISLADFNLDASLLPKVVTDDTLCIVAVHMFGIVMPGLELLPQTFSNTVIIEDACQSLGSTTQGRQSGSAGTISFFSFNKGKNLPTFGGGCVAVDDDVFFKKLSRPAVPLPCPGLPQVAAGVLKMYALSLAMNPWLYGIFYSLISRFKDTAPPPDVRCMHYTAGQAGVAESLLRHITLWSNQRYANGMAIINGLRGMPELILPAIPADTQPAFNRLPLVFRDPDRRERVERNLRKAGIETSRMYEKPLHHMFDLGYARDNFPNAVYLAGHLLTLPVHPLLRSPEIDKMITVIRKS